MKRPRATSSAADVAAAELPAEAAAAAGAAAAGDTSGENHAALPAAAGGAKPAKLRAPAALAWMRVPAPIDAARVIMLSDLAELDPRLQETLRASHIDRLFPVQAAVWDTLRSERREAHDICLNAPTGSGKTLAYALPVCAALSGRIIRRLRALVVLPTHDLAHQVGAVFRPLCDAVGLSVAVASGKGTLAGEAAALVQQQGEHTESCVDVLVVTPGRLVAHMQSTPGFTLQHLRYLVVDEADRLLRQAYQDWLPLVLSATQPAPVAALPWGLQSGAGHMPPRTDAAFVISAQRRCRGSTQGDRAVTPRLLKFVVSATLTRDPSKIGRLQLYSPLLLNASADDQRYQLPQQLRQWRVIASAEEKPLALLALLQELSGAPTIVFAGSVEATHRLFLMLQACDSSAPARCVEYSSLQSHADRTRALEAFRAQHATVLVASDAATRGLDVEGVEAVISYDTPVYLKTYVHRVGRTARAGRAGQAFTLLRPQEVRHFKAMLTKADSAPVRVRTLAPEALASFAPECARALARVAEACAGSAATSKGPVQLPSPAAPR